MAVLSRRLGLRDLAPQSGGIESVILRGQSPAFGPVAVKVPRLTRYANVNDPHTQVADLYRQEFWLLEHLRAHGITFVPRPCHLDTTPGQECLVLEWVSGDGRGADPAEVGRLMAAIHQLPLPPRGTVAQQGLPASELVPRRLHRRLATLAAIVSRRWSAPPAAELTTRLKAASAQEGLLHLDLRQANVIGRDGSLLALLDWSNALVGPPALEVARLVEISDLDADRFLTGYGSVAGPPATTPAESLCYRLDAAVMLALVFVAEDPDPGRVPAAIERVDQLVRQLNRAVG